MAKLARDLNTGRLLRHSSGKLCRGCCGTAEIPSVTGCSIADTLGLSTPRVVKVTVGFPDLSCCLYRSGWTYHAYKFIMDAFSIDLSLDRTPNNNSGCFWQGFYEVDLPLFAVDTYYGWPEQLFDIYPDLACSVWSVQSTTNFIILLELH